MRYLLLTITLLAFQANAQVPAFDPVGPEALLVVYNLNDADDDGDSISNSEELARYYQQKRGVPESNMLGISVSTSSYRYYHMPGWENFWDEFYTPVKNRILQLGQKKIKYILLCDQMPYEINLTDKLTYTPSYHNRRSLDNSLVTLNFMGSRVNPWYPQFWVVNPFFEQTPLWGKDHGQFHADSFKVSGTNMYLVSRIMTESHDMNINIVDMSLYGEKYIHTDSGYYNGIAYADNRYGNHSDSLLRALYPFNANGSYPDWDSNACYLKVLFADFDFEVKHEANDWEIGEANAVFTDSTSGVTAPNALLYGGWYNYNKYHDPFWWLPGSVASDLNSNSAAKIRDGFSGGTFLAGSFARGLTAGTGVIIEPYLTGHSRADILHLYMLNGHNFIEAAYHAEPSLRWMNIVLGDPLYRPFEPNKTPVLDTGVQRSYTTINFIDTAQTEIKLDYFVTADAPEVVKAKIMWGTSTTYTDTIPFDRIWMAHHKFLLAGLNATDTFHFQICAEDPVGNSWCSADRTFTTPGTTNLIEAWFNGPEEACPNDTVSFFNTSSGSNRYEWWVNGVLTDSTHDLTLGLNSGMHNIQLVAINGSMTDTFMSQVSVSPEPLADFSISTNMSTVDLTDLSIGAQDYIWDFGNGDTSHDVNPIYAYDSLGTYTVCLTITNECGTDSTCQTVTVTILDAASPKPEALSISPNPASGPVTIGMHALHSGKHYIEFYDMLGQRLLVLEAQLNVGGNKLILEPVLPGGSYVVRMRDEAGVLATSRLTITSR
jgi:uncharacterized protein (TIGR03790 family)